MGAQADLFEFARMRRDIGIERVVAKADDVAPGWSNVAYADVIPRAQRCRVVRKDGFAPAHSSNLSPKIRWVPL